MRFLQAAANTLANAVEETLETVKQASEEEGWVGDETMDVIPSAAPQRTTPPPHGRPYGTPPPAAPEADIEPMTREGAVGAYGEQVEEQVREGTRQGGGHVR
jgi:hypothetical protein